MKCSNNPLLWRKFFLNIVNNGDFVYNYCNRPFNNFHRHYREWLLYSNNGGDDLRMPKDEMIIYGTFW